MRSNDFERPLFRFTRHCLFSTVFVKSHGSTSYHVFIHDLDRQELVKKIFERLEAEGGSKRVLDYLIDDLRIRGDVLVTINSHGMLHHGEDVIDADDPERLALFAAGEDTASFREYLNSFHSIFPGIAAVHVIPPILAEGLRLSITFGLLNNQAEQCANPFFTSAMKEIFEAKVKIHAYLYSVLAVLEGRLYASQSIRAAVGAIMGRVNAHDFGHVLSNAQLNQRDDPVDQADYFKHLTRFLRGLMVFSAEAATSDPAWSMPLQLLGQLIQSFACCSQPERRDSPGVPAGFKRFQPSPVCRHLAQSEGVKQTRIRTLLNGEEVEHLFDQGKGRNVGSTRRVRDNAPASDMLIDVPAGLIGSHALYCIFENVIRNGAKYGKNRSEELYLTVDVRTRQKTDPAADLERASREHDLVRVRVWDDHSIYDPDQFRKICLFFRKSSRPKFINDDDKHKTESHDELWRITDDQGQLVNGGWGLKEMRVAAAWLRQASATKVLDRQGLELPLLRPLLLDDQGRSIDEAGLPANSEGIHFENGSRSVERIYMGYEFYLRRPGHAVIVHGNVASMFPERDRLQELGIETLTDLRTALEEGMPRKCCLLYDQDLDMIEKQRDHLSPVLLVSQGPELPHGATFLDIPLSAKIVSQCKGAYPLGILEGHKRWLQHVLGAPRDLTLTLQLSASEDVRALDEVVKPWQELSETLESLEPDGGRWTVEAPAICEVWNRSQPPVVYDYHGVWASVNSNYFVSPTSGSFYEKFVGIQPTQTLLFNPPTDQWTRLQICFGLIEAALAPVEVIDERLCTRFAPEEVRRLEQAGVFLVTDEKIYRHPDAGWSQQLLDWFVEHRVKIVLVHQGMLDKMFKTRQDAEDWVEKVKREANVPFVVVQSDRGGLLPKLPRNARFLPFSAIQPWFSDEGGATANKYFLVQSLLAARARTEETWKIQEN